MGRFSDSHMQTSYAHPFQYSAYTTRFVGKTKVKINCGLRPTYDLDRNLFRQIFTLRVTTGVCYRNDNWEYYQGSTSTTINGRPCQRWDQDTPNDPRYDLKTSFFFSSENYCRGAYDTIQPWCYNGLGTTPRWELCSVLECCKYILFFYCRHR